MISGSTRARGLGFWFGFAAWVMVAVGGFYALAVYQNTPGADAVLVSWPEGLDEQPAPDRATLMVFLHPRCACSKASLRELERLMARLQDEVEVRASFVLPPGSDGSWREGELWEQARAIAGLQLSFDPEGARAHRFGAKTSGQMFLFRPDGRLLFRGGITAARAHEGDNAGRDAVFQLVREPGSDRFAEASVYGCALFHPSLEMPERGS